MINTYIKREGGRAVMAHDSSFFYAYTSATSVYSCGEIFVGSNPTLLIISFCIFLFYLGCKTLNGQPVMLIRFLIQSKLQFLKKVE